MLKKYRLLKGLMFIKIAYFFNKQKEEAIMKKIVWTIFLLLLIPTLCFGGNIDTFGVGAKATALGGAYAAYA